MMFPILIVLDTLNSGRSKRRLPLTCLNFCNNPFAFEFATENFKI